MTFVAARRLDNTAIIVVTYADQVTIHDVEAADPIVAPLIAAIGQDTALIMDIRASETTFAEIFNILRARRGVAAAHAAPFQVIPMFVSTASLAKLYVQAAQQKQFGGQQIALFTTLEDAVAAAGVLLAQLQAERHP